jgi:hypothetical protein
MQDACRQKQRDIIRISKDPDMSQKGGREEMEDELKGREESNKEKKKTKKQTKTKP